MSQMRLHAAGMEKYRLKYIVFLCCSVDLRDLADLGDLAP